MPASTFLPTFSVCVCTRDNPDGLRQTLQSVAQSTTPPQQLIVSDDSSNYETREMMRGEFPDVTYLEGPRRACAANRNRAVRAATGTHVLILDDRTLLGLTFLQQMSERIADDHIHQASAGAPAAPLILTGTDLCGAERGRPRKPTFLGRPALDYRYGERLCSVVLHSTVFPRALFDQIAFDEDLAAGYDEIDLAGRAVYECHCRIELMPSAVNRHATPPARDEPAAACEASRLYVTFWRYGHSQHRRGKAVLFLAFALPHQLAHQLHQAGWRGVAPFCATAQRLWRHLRRRPDASGGAGHGGLQAGVRMPFPRD
ncbi:glycosyltransferase family 2 protein [Cupriavidus sp. WKF15]|uniref:glycosyltransferase family 2 protein n=1 Tax=Cupriavidus sp. WKF15 TaxID=3032282 RepID=UPI0023E12F85|nr:glycosyltransferase family 2 protein [Cupriavidus sp. WKF15]WER49581.1 glycosyltransferase family 2 protein [Cupriavidus sp. WKF15]